MTPRSGAGGAWLPHRKRDRHQIRRFSGEAEIAALLLSAEPGWQRSANCNDASTSSCQIVISRLLKLAGSGSNRRWRRLTQCTGSHQERMARALLAEVEHTPMTQEEATKSIKTFLESAPLLKPLRIALDPPSRSTNDLLPARLQLPCSHDACRELPSTTWTNVPRIAGTKPSFNDHLVFRCAHCGASQLEIWCILRPEKTVTKQEGATLTNTGISGSQRDYVVEFEILKVGQWPPWAPVVSRRLEKSLGKNLEFFRKAVACIRQSSGIGACAYMRRVIEEETDHILDLVERAAKSEGDEETLANVTAARQGKAASDRLDQAAKKLPRSLCPGGVNPLARLFGAFSEGVHQLPEDKALHQAQELLETFVFLFENLRERIEQEEAFANRIQGVGNPGNRAG